MGVRYVRSFISRTYEMPDTKNLPPGVCQPGNEAGRGRVRHDRAIIGTGAEHHTLQEQAQRMGVVLNRWGFAQTEELRPLDTSRPGVFVGGAASRSPKTFPTPSCRPARPAARAMELLAPARGSEELHVKTYPPERDISDEPPRVGVFVCHCGSKHRLGRGRGTGSQRDPTAAVRNSRRAKHLHLRQRPPGIASRP